MGLPDELTGKLLIAMPGMADPRFERSVILLCAHGEEGAMGLIVNKPARDLDFTALLDQLEIDYSAGLQRRAVHFGGPVEGGRGFVLHSRDYAAEEGTLEVGDGFGMTATLDVLREMATGRGPDSALVALGYAGWGEGQLEDELAGNGWLVADAAPELVFHRDHGDKWRKAIASLGIDPLNLSAMGGSA